MLGKEFAEKYFSLTDRVQGLDCCISILRDRSDGDTTDEAIKVINERKNQLQNDIAYMENLKVIE